MMAIKSKQQHFWTLEERRLIWKKWHQEKKGCKEIAQELDARPMQITGQLDLLCKAYELHKAGVFSDIEQPSNNTLSMDALLRAKKILEANEPEYPIYGIYEGVTYRIESKDAEPVEVSNE